MTEQVFFELVEQLLFELAAQTKETNESIQEICGLLRSIQENAAADA